MTVKYLSFANLTLKLLLPAKMLDCEKYESFFCDEAPFDFCIEYSFASSPLSLPKDEKAYAELDDKVICFDGKTYNVFYKDAFGGCFARRQSRTDSNRITVTLTAEAKKKFWMRLVLNTMGIEELASRKNGFVFHSSFIERKNEAILFTGPCGIGKSTQAKLWNESRNAPIINGDKTLIYFENERFYAAGLPFSGSSGISKNKVLPLRLIVKLSWKNSNKISPLSPKEAFVALLKSIYVPNGLGSQISAVAFSASRKVPIVFFECTPTEAAVDALESYLDKEEEE